MARTSRVSGHSSAGANGEWDDRESFPPRPDVDRQGSVVLFGEPAAWTAEDEG